MRDEEALGEGRLTRSRTESNKILGLVQWPSGASLSVNRAWASHHQERFSRAELAASIRLRR